jgi:hypothetical protein
MQTGTDSMKLFWQLHSDFVNFSDVGMTHDFALHKGHECWQIKLY